MPNDTSAPSPPGLLLRDAQVTFDGARLFERLALDLPPARWTCVLGPSGVGKSSLLRLIAGLIAPENATSLAWQPAPPRRIAWLAQQDLLLPWLSVLDNALLGPRLRGEADIATERQRAIDLLERLGLRDALRQFPATLSGGMRQRVALARTMVEDADVVLMDEPFSQLDAITRHDLQGLAARLFADRTVLLVTHDPTEALRLGHRIVVLAGRPATVASVFDLAGDAPRDISAPDQARLAADLLRRLQQASELSP